jgi:hypothetical protein
MLNRDLVLHIPDDGQKASSIQWLSFTASRVGCAKICSQFVRVLFKNLPILI